MLRILTIWFHLDIPSINRKLYSDRLRWAESTYRLLRAVSRDFETSYFQLHDSKLRIQNIRWRKCLWNDDDDTEVSLTCGQHSERTSCLNSIRFLWRMSWFRGMDMKWVNGCFCLDESAMIDNLEYAAEIPLLSAPLITTEKMKFSIEQT